MIYSIKSYNYPEAYVCHIDNLGFIKSEKEGANVENASFILRKGLANNYCISFELAQFKLHYLIAENGGMKLAKIVNTLAFNNSATFCMRPGNAGRGISFVSYDNPDNFIRHRNGELLITSFSKGRERFQEDSTFHIRESLHN